MTLTYMTFYCMTFKTYLLDDLTVYLIAYDCSIRISWILCSWILLHNSQRFTHILLFYCKDFLWWLFQLQKGQISVHFFKQFAWYAWKLIDILFIELDCRILTKIGFGFISQWYLFRTTKRHCYSIYMPRFQAVYPVGMTTLFYANNHVHVL